MIEYPTKLVDEFIDSLYQPKEWIRTIRKSLFADHEGLIYAISGVVIALLAVLSYAYFMRGGK